MTLKKYRTEQVSETNVIDLILIDHGYVKECIEVLTDEEADKREKLSYAKSFLDTLQKHSMAEKKTIYPYLLDNEELHFNILEAQIEHGIVDQKVRTLKRKLAGVRTLKDELEAEFTVLAELVRHHVKEEEEEILPKMQQEVDEEDLNNLGAEFMKFRKFTAKDLEDYPQFLQAPISSRHITRSELWQQ